MGRRIHHHNYRRREGNPEFLSVLLALIVLSFTGAGSVAWPLFLVLVGAFVALFALKLVFGMVAGMVRILTS